MIASAVSPFPDAGPCNDLCRSLGFRPQLLSRAQDVAADWDLDDFIVESTILQLRAHYEGGVHRDAWDQVLQRTMTGQPGGDGALALPYDVSARVLDRARALSAVWGMIRWQKVRTREWRCPYNGEVSRATGSRWGGFQATWGLGETTMPSAVDGKVNNRTFYNTRCLLLTHTSRDLWEDSERAKLWLSECGYKEIAASIENVIINGTGRVGTPGLSGPTGLVNQPATVVVAKGSTPSNQISAANIDAQWQALPEANSYSAVWMCNKHTAGFIDTLATSGQWPELQYLRAGQDYRWPYASLKGRPVVWSEFCPVLGNPGDLILWDPQDFLITYLPIAELSASALAWTVGLDPASIQVNSRPVDPLGTGMIALPEGALEQRMSGEQYFDTDLVTCAWKMRMDFGPVWSSTVIGVDGNTYGPCAIVAQR